MYSNTSGHFYLSAIKICIYSSLLILIHASTLGRLATHDWTRDDFNYGYVIPLVVLYLIWDKRDVISAIEPRPSWLALLPLVLGLCLFWLGELGGEFYMLYLSLWFLLVAICWLELGWGRVRKLWFAFVMLLTMFPPPHFIYTKISFFLRLASSKLCVGMIRLYGMAAYREGNVIDLGFTKLQVVDACSGLRYLISLLVLALLLVYFYKASLWKRVLVMLSALPLSIVSNSLRIALMGILYRAFGPVIAEGFYHGFSGWFVFMFSLGVLLLEMWLLGHTGKRGNGGREKSNSVLLRQGGKARRDRRPACPAVARSAVAVVLLGATLGMAQGLDFRQTVPVWKPLKEYPLRLGDWHGERQTMEKPFIDVLDLSDYLLADYRNPLGKVVNLYVAYYATQRKGESIHSPATCLKGGGWEFKRAGRHRIPTLSSDAAPVAVNRAIVQKGDAKQLAYYWFPQRGRVLTNAYELKLYTFWDALTKKRTDGALVRVITPIYPLEGIERAEQRLQNFLKDAVPALGRHLPGKDLIASGAPLQSGARPSRRVSRHETGLFMVQHGQPRHQRAVTVLR